MERRYPYIPTHLHTASTLLSPQIPDTRAHYQPIEDYALIGDLHTAALVGKNGAIDWCCLPRFDAPSVFGALVDAEKGGFFRIAPLSMQDVITKQLYIPETNILITRFLTRDGVAELTDFMPMKAAHSTEHEHHIVRTLTVIRGSLMFTMHCKPAFNYGRDPHTVTFVAQGAVFRSPSLCLGLASSVPLVPDAQDGVEATFTLHSNQSAYFLLQSADPQEQDMCPALCEYQETFQATLHYWRHWLAQCRYQGRWREMVHRSALVLKLLTYAPTGALIAAPTTSLPETMGGIRNWDYRYTWLRDAALTLDSLLMLGFTHEAEAFTEWLVARCHEAKEHGELQPVYTIDGSRDLTEITLAHLEGYGRSAPVRIGNGAYRQKQLDTYGALLDAIFVYNRHRPISYDLWQHIRHLLAWLHDHWDEPDDGIWEVRGGQHNFVHSRLMSWVAFDRAIRLAQQRGLPAPLAEWQTTTSRIYEQIMQQGWSAQKQSFTQYYGSEAIDASALLLSLTRFTGATDPYMLRTLERIQHELAYDALVYRYRPAVAAPDGLNSSEGTFTPCSFWLAEALALAGQAEEARLLLEKMFTYSNHVGLYAEEIDPMGRAVGNFPQALTHLALITACYRVDRALDG